jgi:PAS domain S-box-containing protein
MDSALLKLTRCFLKFGLVADRNIDIITRTAGEILDSSCVLYNRLEGDSLHTISSWQAPPDMPRRDTAKGHLCFDMLSHMKDGAFIVKDLDNSAYAVSDPNVRKYGLKAYIGYPVKVKGRTTGSLCAVFRTNREITTDEIRILTILAKALGIEEQRKLADDRLKGSEEKYRTIINASQDITYAANPEARITFVSRQICQYGYTPGEMIGRHIREFCHPDDRYYLQQAFENAIRTGVPLPMICYRIKKKGGGYFHAEQKSCVIMQNGKPLMLSGVIRDVTERDQLRSRAEENEKTLQTLFDTAKDAIFIKNTRGRYVKANKTCAELFGTAPERMIGKTDADLFPEGAPDEVLAQDKLVLAKGETLFVDNLRNTPQGRRFMNVMKTPLKNANGEITGLLAIARDITDRKEMEAELIRVKAIEAVNLVAQPAAHDFNNILSAITGYATLIMETLKTGNPVKPEIEQILNAVKRAAAITSRLQTYGAGAGGPARPEIPVRSAGRARRPSARQGTRN